MESYQSDDDLTLQMGNIKLSSGVSGISDNIDLANDAYNFHKRDAII